MEAPAETVHQHSRRRIWIREHHWLKNVFKKNENLSSENTDNIGDGWSNKILTASCFQSIADFFFLCCWSFTHAVAEQMMAACPPSIHHTATVPPDEWICCRLPRCSLLFSSLSSLLLDLLVSLLVRLSTCMPSGSDSPQKAGLQPCHVSLWLQGQY